MKIDLIDATIAEWEEWLEMYPGDEWVILSHILAHKLQKQIDETTYYKRIADASFGTKHP